MIRHIVFFSAKNPAELPRIRAGLELLATIPHSDRFEIAANHKVDPLCDAIDLVVYAEFPDAAALEAYKADPTYARATETVRPLRELRYSADVEAGENLSGRP